MDASISYELSKKVLGALDNGVPLTIQLQIQVLRQREWLWDELSADIQQRFRLEYHALARQYLVTNLNNGELNSFPTLWAATDFLGQVHDFPLIDSSHVIHARADEMPNGGIFTFNDVAKLRQSADACCTVII